RRRIEQASPVPLPVPRIERQQADEAGPNKLLLARQRRANQTKPQQRHHETRLHWHEDDAKGVRGSRPLVGAAAWRRGWIVPTRARRSAPPQADSRRRCESRIVSPAGQGALLAARPSRRA